MSGKIFLVDQIAGFFKVKKKLKDPVDFVLADKQIFLQISTIAIDGLDQACPKYPK